MTIDSLIMLAGALIAALPFLGIPNRVDSIIFALLGVCVISLGIIVRRRKEKKPRRRTTREAHFVENSPVQTSSSDTVWQTEVRSESDLHEVR